MATDDLKKLIEADETLNRLLGRVRPSRPVYQVKPPRSRKASEALAQRRAAIAAAREERRLARLARIAADKREKEIRRLERFTGEMLRAEAAAEQRAQKIKAAVRRREAIEARRALRVAKLLALPYRSTVNDTDGFGEFRYDENLGNGGRWVQQPKMYVPDVLDDLEAWASGTQNQNLRRHIDTFLSLFLRKRTPPKRSGRSRPSDPLL